MRGKPDGIGVDYSLPNLPLEVWKLFASELLKRGRNMGISPPFPGKQEQRRNFYTEATVLLERISDIFSGRIQYKPWHLHKDIIIFYQKPEDIYFTTGRKQAIIASRINKWRCAALWQRE